MFSFTHFNRLASAAILVGSLAVASESVANTVTNDTQPIGRRWGSGTESPGDPMYTEDSIALTVWEYRLGGSSYFNEALITAPISGFGTSNLMNLNNVCTQFDLSAIGGSDCVEFEYADIGGSENLWVNGSATYWEVPFLSALDGVEVAPGVFATVTESVIPGGVKGVVRLDGPVQRVRLGGQEFWWDNFSTDCGSVEPCPNLVSHESLPLGVKFGNCAGQAPGDFAFNEGGMDVYVDVIEYTPTTTGFDCAEVQSSFAGFGDSHIMMLANLTAIYDMSPLACTVTEVTIEFRDEGGIENFQVNGATLYRGDLFVDVPANPAPGVTYAISGTPDDALITLTGVIHEVRIGGQEFWVDNICATCGTPPEPCENLVDHESLPIGTAFGACVGQSPGDYAFTEGGIDVYTDEIVYVSGATGYNCADVQASFGGFGDSHIMMLNNITTIYDLSPLGCPVTEVTIEFRDMGGDANFQVNGGPLFIGDLFVDVPPNPAAGVTYSVSGTPNDGLITLTGLIDKVRIGGQEFWVDNICAECGEPPADCEFLVHHESQLLGQCYGPCSGHVPGDLWFAENGIRVFGERFDTGSGVAFNQATIDLAFSGFGDAHVMALNNISARYGMGAIPCDVEKVTFEFIDLGGIENFRVNGGTLYVGDIDVVVPPNPAPGVTFSITTVAVPGGIRGEVTLEGPIQSFLVGGQEFWVDNICAECGVLDAGAASTPSAQTQLAPVTPNPARPHATMAFTLADQGRVELAVYDVQGRRVATLVEGVRAAGHHQVVWDGRTDAGSLARSGAYFVRLKTGAESQTRKIMFVR